MHRIALTLTLLLLSGCGVSFPVKTAAKQDRPIMLLVVRHAETDPSKPNLPLSVAGEARARVLTDTVRGVKFSHLLSTHTVRAKQMLQGTADRLSLPIIQWPVPGSSWEGETVTDQTSRRAPIEPMIAAVRALPPGSVALLALNSENIFAILNGLGVPVASPCSTGALCVPCTDNSCYPRNDFDHLWHVVIPVGGNAPVVFTGLRYGQGWRP